MKAEILGFVIWGLGFSAHQEPRLRVSVLGIQGLWSKPATPNPKPKPQTLNP